MSRFTKCCVCNIKIWKPSKRCKKHAKRKELHPKYVNSIDKIILINLYLKEKKSIKFIAKKINCSISTIRRRLIEYHIRIRTISEIQKSIKGKGKHSYRTGKYCVPNYCFCGKKIDFNAKRCRSCAGKIHSIKIRKNKNPNWKGNKTPLILSLRTSDKYLKWRNKIFKRDNYTCQKCGDRTGGNLEAHHIMGFAFLVHTYKITTIEQAIENSKLWKINNGLTLCEKCHYELHFILKSWRKECQK